METRKLGNTDLDITPIGFGAWAIGGEGWAFSWGPQDDDQSISAIREAIDQGINWIDTAAAYGLGHSEEVVARALKGVSARPYIFTKCSLVWDDQRKLHNVLKADSIRREVEGSLRRLQVDVIDLYQMHWPRPDEDIEEGWSTMAELKAEGKVRYIGASNYTVDQLKRAQAIAPIDSLQPPYSLVRPEVGEEILPYCRQQNIGVIVYAPMMSGLLTGAMTRERIAALPKGDWRPNSPYFQEPQLTRNLELVERLREIGKRHGVEPGVVAIAWTLHNPAVTAAIVGGRSPKQVDGVMPAATFRLSDAEAAELQEFIEQHP